MGIAGIKPVKVEYLDDDVFIENAWDNPEAEIHAGFPMTFVGYDETRVRDILIKFEDQGFRWNVGDTPTSFVPSEVFNFK